MPPEDVLRWVQERDEARRGRDFPRADELRARAREAGWEIVDRPDGYELRPVAPARPATPAVSVIADVEGWAEDGQRFLASLERHPPGDGAVEVVGAAGADFAAARNAALREARAPVVVLADTSLELTGDLLGILATALADPDVAVAGPFGLVSADLREYEERTTGDVAAVQGYCLAARRDDLVGAGGIRDGFTFYRNADIDLSLRLRTLGPSRRRAVAVGADRCVRHTHRDWEASEPSERDRLSRKNMQRVLRRFGHRLDLAVP